MGRNCSKSIFVRLVKFGRSVFYLFGRLVKYSAVQFSIYLVVWIRPTVQVRFLLQIKSTLKTDIIACFPETEVLNFRACDVSVDEKQVHFFSCRWRYAGSVCHSSDFQSCHANKVDRCSKKHVLYTVLKQLGLEAKNSQKFNFFCFSFLSEFCSSANGILH